MLGSAAFAAAAEIGLEAVRPPLPERDPRPYQLRDVERASLVRPEGGRRAVILFAH
jgi:hypothetical protein